MMNNHLSHVTTLQSSWRRIVITTMYLLMFLVIVSACSTKNEVSPASNNPITSQEQPSHVGNNEPVPATPATSATTPPPPEPFELKIYASGVASTEFDARFRTTLESKFPHITFNYLPYDAGNSIEELVARGEIPDIMRVLNSRLQTTYLNLGLGYDISELIKKYNYDITRFEPIFISSLIETGKTGELYGLPVPPYFVRVLYYNKELFERFGVEPPQDGMNWDDIYGLASRMSRTDGGVAYRGFSMNIGTLASYNEFSAPILDPVQDGLHGFDTWRTILDNYVRFYRLPDNPISDSASLESTIFQNGHVAMSVNVFSPYVQFGEVDWDMAAIPLIEGAPRQAGFFTPGNWMITQQSKYKDEAFQVIMEMLSDEIQLQDSKNGITTTLVNQDIKNQLGQGHEVYKTKNLGAVNYHTLGPLPPGRDPGVVPVDASIASALMNETFLKAARGELDSNSALRELDEKLKQEVEKARSSR